MVRASCSSRAVRSVRFSQRYVVYDAGFTLLQLGPVGEDLGGYYSQFWETPEPIQHNGAQFVIKGRSYLVSPFACLANQEISVNAEAFVNLGVMWYTKIIEETGQ